VGAPGQDIVGIRAAALAEWFEANVAGARGPLAFDQIAGGHSNLTYRVTDAVGNVFVLRRPPTGPLLPSAHDMAREHRIISGVGRSGVPVPEALGLCTDTSVNDQPFYVMRFVPGVVLDDPAKVTASYPPPTRRTIGESVVTTLAVLHAVDPADVGLGDLGKREDYLPRQLRRWRGQWEASKTRELVTMEAVADALEQAVPAQVGSGIVHGDYRLGNMLVDPDGAIAAVLDWELCTLGDVLADVGYLLNNWVQPGEEGPATTGAAMPPTLAGGFATREELVARYEELTGRDCSGIAYYRAFQYWRFAVIMEGVLDRYTKGAMGDAGDTEAFRLQVEACADEALGLIRSWG